MNYDMELSLGVKDYCCLLAMPCAENKTMPVTVHFSFTIHGNFLSAAMSDNLLDTIDYQSLGECIAKAIAGHNCHAHQQILNSAQTTILGFSPLITGGYFSLTMRCHETFIASQRLL